jgi:hypothetical protein
LLFYSLMWNLVSYMKFLTLLCSFSHFLYCYFASFSLLELHFCVVTLLFVQLYFHFSFFLFIYLLVCLYVAVAPYFCCSCTSFVWLLFKLCNYYITNTPMHVKSFVKSKLIHSLHWKDKHDWGETSVFLVLLFCTRQKCKLMHET